MSALIEQFKKEHSAIMAILKEVKDMNIHSEEGRSKLMSAKDILLKHLKHEDEHLYPVVRKAAVHNRDLQKELDIFSTEPEYVSRVVSEFFDKYSVGTVDKDFQINFESLLATLSARIQHEEESLYAEYEIIKEQK